MKKRMNRLTAVILAVSMICMLPGTAVFAEDIADQDVKAAAGIEDVSDADAEASTGPGAAGGDVEETDGSESITDGNAGDAAGAEELIKEDLEQTDGSEDTADAGAAEAGGTQEAADENAVEVAGADEVVEISGLSGDVFDDVNAGDWHVPYVSYVLNKGIMTGKGENLFAPSENLSRAQFATVLYRIAGSPNVGYSDVFPDVPDGKFFTMPAMWASQEEVAVITGYEDGRFAPGDMINREQMATMLYRYAEYRDSKEDDEADEDKETEAAEADKTSGLDKFPDTWQVSDFAKEAMEWAIGAGIITGDGGNLNPLGNTSRAVCATMIQRFCEKFMPGELEDIEMSASCQNVSIGQTSVDNGTFWVRAEGVKASMDIQKIQAKVWCYEDDARWYTLEEQPDGSYGAEGSVTSHKVRFGTYYAEFYVMLGNGVRLYLNWSEAGIDGSEAQMRVLGHVNNIYNEVGRDLYACYMWVVNNVSYLRLPDPLEPPEGYTRAEWYAIMAYEQGQGNCYCFAAAFYFLAKGLGYDAEFIEGRVKLRSGGYNRHGWVIIHLDGASYICDPESTRDIGRYNFYMQPVDSPVMQYEW